MTVPVGPGAACVAHETCCEVQSQVSVPRSPSSDSGVKPLGSVKVFEPPCPNQSTPEASSSVQFVAVVAKPVELPLTGFIPAAEEKLASELSIGMTLLAPDKAMSAIADEPLPMPGP